MNYHIFSQKDFAATCAALEPAAKAHQFGVLGVRDMQETLQSKGKVLAEPCRIFDLCNPGHAERILGLDPSLAVALPCRVAVYQNQGKVHLAMMDPAVLVQGLTSNTEIHQLAGEVRQTLATILELAASA